MKLAAGQRREETQNDVRPQGRDGQMDRAGRKIDRRSGCPEVPAGHRPAELLPQPCREDVVVRIDGSHADAEGTAAADRDDREIIGRVELGRSVAVPVRAIEDVFRAIERMPASLVVSLLAVGSVPQALFAGRVA
jgi:hypothetical protein